MVKPNRPKTLAEQVADLEGPRPADFDPEEINGHHALSDDSDSDASGGEDQAREHYIDVGKSKLRKRGDVSLGPQYKGSKVGREEAFDVEGDDPFDREDWDDEESSDEELAVGATRSAANGLNGSDTSGSGEEMLDSDDTGNEDDESNVSSNGADLDRGHGQEVDRAELRRIMADEQKSVAATISSAAKADAAKGKAVKAQRATFDKLLNVRIRLQKSLISTNSLAAEKEDADQGLPSDIVKAAEDAAVSLWNSLNDYRTSLQEARTGTKRKHFETSADSSSEALWAQMQSYESAERPHRLALLDKWSAKSRGASAVLASSKGRLGNAAQQSLSEVLSAQLLDSSRLIKRTRVARSCAPVQAKAGIHESDAIYDDADFYGLLLKELLEQRTDAGAQGGIGSEFTFGAPWQAVRDAKTKKAVDTKASKGRKQRYTVEEKLLNFAAPEDRGSWSKREVENLFGSLFGRKASLGEDVEGDDESGEDGRDDDDVTPKEMSMRLYR